jgi:GNAT superfamily N-acetyltransferase
MNVLVREARPDDAPALSRLSHQLGYAINTEKTSHHLRLILGEKNGMVFVATEDGTLIGWIQVGIKSTLESGLIHEIYGMVVDENFRNKGIGKILLQTGIRWLQRQGAMRIRVRSNAKRTGAHLFYEKQGFGLHKEQKVFELKIQE